MSAPTIIFDLDGTLVDTAPDLLRALNETMALEGLPQVTLERVRKWIGQGARVTIERAAAFSGVNFSEDRLDQLTNAFVDFYRVDIARLSQPFPGAVAAMDILAAEGAKLAVCTNKRTELSVQLLDALGLTARFSAIVGADLVTNRKPHPEHFRATVERAGGVVRRAVMIGDTVADVAAARGAGAPVIVVTFGYGDCEPDQLGADVLMERYADLPQICSRLLAARRP